MSTAAAVSSLWCPPRCLNAPATSFWSWPGETPPGMLWFFAHLPEPGVLSGQLKSTNCHVFSSQEIGLPVGLRALVVPRAALPKGIPLETGGGTIRLVSQGNVVWASAPDRFEAGTPPVLNVVAFARALQMRAQGWEFHQTQTSGDGISPSQILDQDDYFPEYSGARLLEQLREDCVGRANMVPTAAGMRRYVNLDNAASTPAFSAVWRAVRQTWRMPREHWPGAGSKGQRSLRAVLQRPQSCL